MINVNDIIAEVVKLKDQATIRKTRNLYTEAIEIFQDAINKINDILLSHGDAFTNEEKEKLKDELADCHGQIGGVYRRWAFSETDAAEKKQKFKLSYEAYDKGYEFEKESTKLTTYNLLNRLTSRIFYNPEWMNSHSPESPEKEFLHKELPLAQEKILEQMKKGREDIWGWADVGQISLLLNSVTPKASFEKFLKKVRNNKDYRSLVDLLKPLADLPIDAKDNINTVIDFLEKNV